ncbi:MAG: hypothetical protein KAJ19_11285, partial [Gammaproteobacteria bacterium]|nr:hypothetical protein [Gammaproteobacteria bacterium]
MGPAALLLIAGAPEGMIVPSARLAGILVAALSLLVVARCGSFPEAGRSAGAWFLAASPLWIEAALGAEAHLLVGLVFLVLSRGLLPLWLRVALLGWVLGWSPWAWVSVLLLPAAKRLRGVSVVLPALVALWILNPPALLQPEAWISGMLRQAQLQGIWSSEAHFGIRQGLYPITGTLHVPGLILVALAARGWARRSRAGDLAPCICLLVLLLGLRSGYTSPAPLLILL